MKISTLKEAIKLNVAMPYRRAWNPERYKALFAAAGAKYRIYIPVDVEIPLSEVSERNFNEIKQILEDLSLTSLRIDTSQFTPEMYKKGLVVVGKQKIKLVKFLNQVMGDLDNTTLPKHEKVFIAQQIRSALSNFNNDKTRLKNDKTMIVISRHPYDVAGMSTDRHWKSCMNLYGGTENHYVIEDVKHGSLIAYLIKESDRNIKNPISRVLIAAYINKIDPTDFILKANGKVYGTSVPKFRDTVQEFLDELNNQKSKATGLYCRNENLYDDGDESTIIHNANEPITDQATMFAIATAIRGLPDMSLIRLFVNPSFDVVGKVFQKALYYGDWHNMQPVVNWILEKTEFIDGLAKLFRDSDFSTVSLNLPDRKFMITYISLLKFFKYLASNDVETLKKFVDVEVVKKIIRSHKGNGYNFIQTMVVPDTYQMILSINDRIELLNEFHKNNTTNSTVTLFAHLSLENKPVLFLTTLLKVLPGMVTTVTFEEYFRKNLPVLRKVLVGLKNNKRAFNKIVSSMPESYMTSDEIRPILEQHIMSSDENFMEFDYNKTIIASQKILDFVLTKISVEDLESENPSAIQDSYLSFLRRLISDHSGNLEVEGSKLQSTEYCISEIIKVVPDVLVIIINNYFNAIEHKVPQILMKLLQESPKSLLKLKAEYHNISLMYSIANIIVEISDEKDKKNLVYLIPILYKLYLKSIAAGSHHSRGLETMLDKIGGDWNSAVKRFKDMGYI